MKKKDILIVIIPIVIILILVIIRSSNKNNFSTDAIQTHELSLDQKHVLSMEQLKVKLKSSENTVLIDLRNQKDFEKGRLKNAINIQFNQILENQKLKNLKSSDNEIAMYSNSAIESAKAWTLLTQMGFKKLYLLDIPDDLISENILEKDTILEGNEVLKYKFQPDTVVGLE
jgi:rhodanese-related sulfurtransferase